MSGKIFINYRRGDDPGNTGRLFDRLQEAFQPDQLFMDVDNIKPGLDFVKVLEEQVSTCDIVLAVIGHNWIDARDEAGNRRLDNPEDFVRVEIGSALAQGKRVIPVLVGETRMPRSDQLPDPIKLLARRHAVRLTHERFRADVQGLVRALREALEEADARRRSDERKQQEEAVARQQGEPERQRRDIQARLRVEDEDRQRTPEVERRQREPKTKHSKGDEADRLVPETKKLGDTEKLADDRVELLPYPDKKAGMARQAERSWWRGLEWWPSRPVKRIAMLVVAVVAASAVSIYAAAAYFHPSWLNDNFCHDRSVLDQVRVLFEIPSDRNLMSLDMFGPYCQVMLTDRTGRVVRYQVYGWPGFYTVFRSETFR